MTKSAAATLKQLGARLEEQALEIATLRGALDVQFKRIAQMQAELDLLPIVRRQWQTSRLLPAEPRSHNGQHRSHD